MSISNLLNIIADSLAREFRIVYLLQGKSCIMRSTNTSGPLSVQAISGTYVVLLGINMAETEKDGVLGFGIQRTI